MEARRKELDAAEWKRRENRQQPSTILPGGLKNTVDEMNLGNERDFVPSAAMEMPIRSVTNGAEAVLNTRKDLSGAMEVLKKQDVAWMNFVKEKIEKGRDRMEPEKSGFVETFRDYEEALRGAIEGVPGEVWLRRQSAISGPIAPEKRKAKETEVYRAAKKKVDGMKADLEVKLGTCVWTGACHIQDSH